MNDLKNRQGSQDRLKILTGLRESTRLAWKAGSGLFAAIILGVAFSSLTPVASLWITRELVNVISSLRYNPQGARVAIMLILLQLAVNILGSLLSVIIVVLETKLQERLSFYLQNLVSMKVLSLPYQQLEQPDTLDRLHRVKSGLANRALGLLRETLQIGQSALVSVTLVTVLASTHWMLAVLTIGTVFPSVLVQFKFGQHNYSLSHSQTVQTRRAWYLSELLSDRQAAKEIRAFGIGQKLLDQWKSVFISLS